LSRDDRLRCQPDFGCPLNLDSLVSVQKSLVSRGWVGVATDLAAPKLRFLGL
jgi:hypothetical protein